MHSPVTLSKPFLSLGCTPSRVTLQSHCGVHSLNTGSVCWHQKGKKKMSTRLFGGSEREKKQESGRLGLIPVGGLPREKPAGPGAVCKMLEQPREPSAWHFLRASHFLFCLRAKVLSLSAGGKAEASCLPSHRGGFFPSQMEYIPGAFPRAGRGRHAAVTQTRAGVG